MSKMPFQFFYIFKNVFLFVYILLLWLVKNKPRINSLNAHEDLHEKIILIWSSVVFPTNEKYP